MDTLFWIKVLTRWLHVASAAVVVGGLVYAGLVLGPALLRGGAAPLPEGVQGRFRTLLHSALGLILLTGLYNFIVALPRVSALGEAKSLYHGIIGTKILLALVLFGVVSALVSRRREGGGGPYPLAIGIALVVLLLSAVLRRLWDLAIVVS